MRNAEIIFSRPSTLELTIHENGASPCVVSRPEYYLLHLGKMERDSIFLLDDPARSDIKHFRFLLFLGPEAHFELLLEAFFHLSKVSFESSEYIFDSVVTDIITNVQQPWIRLDYIGIIIYEQGSEKFLGRSRLGLADVVNALVIRPPHRAQYLS